MKATARHARLTAITAAQVPPATKIRKFTELGLIPHLNGHPLSTDKAITHAHARGQHNPTRHLTFPTPTGTYTATFTRKSHTRGEGYQQSWCTFHDALSFLPKNPTDAPTGPVSITYYNASGQVLAAAPNATPVEHSTTLAHLSQRRSGWRWTGTRFVRNRIAYAEVTTTHGTDRYAR